MSCDLHAGTIADLARDVVIHRDVAAAARAHLAECSACAAHFQHQRALTADLRRLAASAAAAKPSADVKRRLLGAFAAADRANPAARGNVARRVPPLVRQPRYPRLVAAVVLAAVGLGWWWTLEKRAPVQQPPVISAGPQLPAAAPAASVTEAPRGALARPRGARRARPIAPSAVAEFVGVPGAGALPELESGRIVRVDLPLAALPAYGVDIAATSGQAQVAAELLVGQDGHTRAIRLVQHRP